MQPRHVATVEDATASGAQDLAQLWAQLQKFCDNEIADYNYVHFKQDVDFKQQTTSIKTRMARIKKTGKKMLAPKVHIRKADKEGVSQNDDVAKPGRSCAHVDIQDISDQRPHANLQTEPCDAIAAAGVAGTGKREAALPAHGDTIAPPAQPATNNPTQATLSHSPSAAHGAAEPVIDNKTTQAAPASMTADDAAPLGRGRRTQMGPQRLAEPGAKGSAALGRARRAMAPGTKAHKRPREESPDGKASSGAGACSSATVALLRSPSPASRSPLGNVQSAFAVRAKRSRKGTPVRSSE